MVDTHDASRSAARRPARAVCVLVAALAVAPLGVRAQQGDAFASDSGENQGRPFRDIPERYPDCADLVYEYWQQSDEIEALAEERRTAVDPESSQIADQINDLAAERNNTGDAIIDCVRDATIAARPPLQGGVEQTQLQGGTQGTMLQGGVTKNAPQEPIVLTPEVPQLDPRDGTPAASSSSSSHSTSDVHGVVLPSQPPAAGGQGSSSGGSTSNVYGRILPRQGGGNSGGGGQGGPGGSRVETSVRAELLQRTELPGDPSTGGTVPNTFTNSYFFSQGVMQGLTDAAEATGGQMGQLMIASYYVLTGRVQEASNELGLQPGQSITLQQLEQDLKGWNDVLNGDPQGTNVQHSYDSGRFVGKQLGQKIIAKYGARFREEFGLPEMPSTPAPRGGAPGAAPSDQAR
jgi:hypothetical protein